MKNHTVMKQTEKNPRRDPIDELIIRGLKSTDPDVYGTCVQRFFYKEMQGVLNHIRISIFKGTAEYDELVNELYLLLSKDRWSVLDSFMGYGNARLSTWAGQIAWHHFMRQYLRHGRVELQDQVHTLERDGIEVVSSDEIRMDVAKVISLMPNRRYADVLSLNLIDGYKPEEIAEMFETTVSNIYNIKHRAIRMFLEIYREKRR